MSTSTAPEIVDRERVHPPMAELTADDMFESLTGHEEIAVKQMFGRTAVDLSQVDPLQFMRALIYVEQARRGLKDKQAWNAAQSLTLGQAADYFADDEPEPMPEDPSTDQGKGELATESEPES